MVTKRCLRPYRLRSSQPVQDAFQACASPFCSWVSKRAHNLQILVLSTRFPLFRDKDAHWVPFAQITQNRGSRLPFARRLCFPNPFLYVVMRSSYWVFASFFAKGYLHIPCNHILRKVLSLQRQQLTVPPFSGGDRAPARARVTVPPVRRVLGRASRLRVCAAHLEEVAHSVLRVNQLPATQKRADGLK